MTFCRAQCLLFKRINQSNKSSGNRKFLERYIYVSKDPQKIMQDSIIFDTKWQKIEGPQDLKNQLL